MNCTKWILTVITLTFTNLLLAEKQVITEADQLPRIAYPFDGTVTELLKDETALDGYLERLRADIESQLETFDIRDEATVRQYIGILRTLDFLAGDYDSVLEKIETIRQMHPKEADKLTSGLLLESLVEVLTDGKSQSAEAILPRFATAYAAKVDPLPWDVVQDVIEQTNGGFQYISEALYLGGLENSMQVTVDRTQELSLMDVASLASTKLTLEHVLPLREAVVSVTGAYIEANRVEKVDIWEARDISLDGQEGLTPVIIAINDSGVDSPIFEAYGKMWINPDEVPGDGIDNDENGFIDDIHGPAWDLKWRASSGDLFPMTEEQLAAYPENLDFTKGLLDLQAAIDSPEAASTRDQIRALKQEEYKPFVENLNLYGNYTHGTHVAGIAAEGNPAARILNARMSFNYELIPDKPELETTIRWVESIQDMVDYYKAAGVRVANMSWGGSQAGWEYSLEANGVGDDPEQRAEIARVHFNLVYDGLVAAMASAPEILFIPAAGNSDEDVEFNRIIPSSIDLGNVLVVGAVDQAGEETGFTSYGKNIRAHANGFEVESYVPGGRRLEFSGTSMSAPNVTNLAAKLFAVDPTLTPEEVIALIQLGITKTEDGRRFLIHPAKSMAALQLKLADF